MKPGGVGIKLGIKQASQNVQPVQQRNQWGLCSFVC